MMCNLIGQFIDEQKDIRELVQNLAQQIDAIRNGTHPSHTSAGSNGATEQIPSEVGVPALLGTEDLKRKVARLTEQVGQNTQEISTLAPVMPRVDLMEVRSCDGVVVFQI